MQQTSTPSLDKRFAFGVIPHTILLSSQLLYDHLAFHGFLRATPGTALMDDRTGKVVYMPPQDPDVIRRLLSNLADFYNGDATSLADMAILHYQLETIHPFLDGNGRIGRILNVL